MSSERLELIIGGDASGAMRAMGQVGNKSKALGRKMKRTGRKLTTGLTMPIVGAGAAVLKTAAGFESSMKKVEAAAEPTGKQLEEMEGLAKELGRTTAHSATDAAEGMYYLSSAGFETEEILSSMPSVLNLASAGQMDLAEATDIASNVLSGYGMEAEEIGRVNDVMAKAFQSANVDIGMLGESFAQAGPIAKAAGMSFEESTATLGLLGNAGIQASKAGSTLKNIIGRLIAPSSKAAGVLDDLGVNAQDGEGNMRSLTEILKDMNDAGASTAEIMTVFGKRAGPGMASLLEEGSGELLNLTESLEDSGGTAERVADKQMEGLSGTIKTLKSALEGFALAIADAGVLEFFTGLAEKAQALVSRLAETDPRLLRIGTLVAAAAAALGPLIWALGAVVSAAGTLAPVFGALLGPVGLIIAGVVALAAGLVYAYNRSERFRQIVQTAFAAVKRAVDLVKAAWSAFTALLTSSPIDAEVYSKAQGIMGPLRKVVQVIRWVGDTWSKVWSEVKAFAATVLPQVVEVVQSGIDAVVAIVEWFVGVAQRIWELWGDRFLDTAKHLGRVLARLFRATWENVKQIIDAALRVIRGVFDVFAGIFTGDWRRVWEGIKAIVSGVWSAIHGLVSQAGAVLRAILSTAMNAAKNVALAAWDAMYEGVSDTVSDLIGFVSGIPGQITSALGNLGSLLWSAGSDLIGGLVDGIRSGFDRVKRTVGRLTDMLPSWKGPPSRDAKLLTDNGQLIMSGLVDGIERGTGNVKGALQRVTGIIGGTSMPGMALAGAGGHAGASPVGGAAGGGGGGDRHYDVNVNLGDVDLDDPMAARRFALRLRDELEALDQEES